MIIVPILIKTEITLLFAMLINDFKYLVKQLK